MEKKIDSQLAIAESRRSKAKAITEISLPDVSKEQAEKAIADNVVEE